MIYCLALSNMGREFLVMLCGDPYGPNCFRTTEDACKEFSHYLQIINTTPKRSAVHKKALGRLLNLNPSIVGFDEVEALPEILQWQQTSIYSPAYEILKGKATELLLMKSGFIAEFEQVNILKDTLKIDPVFMANDIGIPVQFSWDILLNQQTKVFIGKVK